MALLSKSARIRDFPKSLKWHRPMQQGSKKNGLAIPLRSRPPGRDNWTIAALVVSTAHHALSASTLPVDVAEAHAPVATPFLVPNSNQVAIGRGTV